MFKKYNIVQFENGKYGVCRSYLFGTFKGYVGLESVVNGGPGEAYFWNKDEFITKYAQTDDLSIAKRSLDILRGVIEKKNGARVKKVISNKDLDLVLAEQRLGGKAS